MGVLDDLLKKTKEAARKNAKTRAAGKKKKKKASVNKKQEEQKKSFTQTRNIDRVRGSRKTTSAPSSKPEEEKKREASAAAWDNFGRSPEGSGLRESMRPVEEDKRRVDPVALQGNTGRTREELERIDTQRELAPYDDYDWLKANMQAVESRNKNKGVGPMAVPDPELDTQFDFRDASGRQKMSETADTLIQNWDKVSAENRVDTANYILQAYGFNDQTRGIIMDTYKNASDSDKLKMLETAVYIDGQSDDVKAMQDMVNNSPTIASAEIDHSSEAQSERAMRTLNRSMVNDYRTYQDQQKYIDRFVEDGRYSRGDALKFKAAYHISNIGQNRLNAFIMDFSDWLRQGQDGYDIGFTDNKMQRWSESKNIFDLAATVGGDVLHDLFSVVGLPASMFSKLFLDESDLQDLTDFAMGLNQGYMDSVALENRIYESANLSAVDRFALDTMGVVIEMIPTILMSITGAPTLGMTDFATSAAGASARQAYEQGATLEESVKYGLSIGTAEAMTEKMFTGFGYMGKGFIAPFVRKLIPEEKILTGATRRILQESGFMDSVSYRIMKGVIASGGEATEEMVMEVVTPYIERATYNPEAMNATISEIGYAGGLGAMAAAVMGLPVTITDVASAKDKSRTYDQIVDDYRQRLMGQLNEAVASGEMTAEEAKAVQAETDDVLSGKGSLNVSDAVPEEKVAGEALDIVYDSYEEAKKAMMQEARTKKDGEKITANYIDNGVVKTFSTTAKGGTLGLGRSTEAGKEYQRIAQAKNVTERSGYQMNVKEEIIKEVSSLSKAIGREVEFYRNDDATDHGYMDKKTGKIYINAGSSQSAARSVIAHELTHQMENTAGWSKLVELMKKHYGSSYESRRQERIDAYEAFGKPLKVDETRKTYDEADQELVAMFVEEKLLTDADTIREVVNTDKTLAQKIIAWINKVIQKLAGNKEQKMLVEARDLWNQALQEEQSGKVKPRTIEVEEEVTDDAGVEVRSSIGKNDKLMSNAEKRNKTTQAVSEEVLEEARKVREEIKEAYQHLFIADNMSERKSPLVGNDSYSGSLDNTTICTRSLTMESIVELVAQRIGRPLRNEEAIVVAQELMEYTGDRAECLYCYQANAKRGFEDALANFLDQRKTVIENHLNGMDKDTNYKLMLDYNFETGKWGKQSNDSTKERFETFIKIAEGKIPKAGALYMANTRVLNENLKDPKVPDVIKNQLKQARKYAQGAVKAHGRVYYAVYNGQILRVSEKKVAEWNNTYGLRMYSFSDFSPAFILENMQMITDASVRGLKMLAYTKEAEFVEIFGSTGMAINISVAGVPDGQGGYHSDGMQGMNWENAKALRDKYPAVGTVYVAKNDAEVEWAMEQDWIDTVIPFHISYGSGMMQRSMGWKNYSSQQSEKKQKDWDGEKGDKKTIYPSAHQNDKETYLRLCEENKLTPKFSQWVDNPNYMKLVNETRLAPNEMSLVEPRFDLDAAKETLDQFAKNGGYNPILGGTQENREYIADEITEKVKNRAPEVKARDGMRYSISRPLKESDLQDYLRAGKRRNKNKQESLARGEKIILTTDEEIRDYIDSAIHGNVDLPTVAYAKVNKVLADAVKNENQNFDIEDFYIELVAAHLLHAYKNHKKAKMKGDIDLTDYDFLDIPNLIENFNEVVDAVKFRSGKSEVILSSAVEQGKVILVETVSASRNSLQFMNMWGVTESKYNAEYKNSSVANSGGNQQGSIISPRFTNTTVDLSIADVSEKSNTRNSIGATKDAEYIEAVNRGDMTTAQRMVDEAAEIALANSKIRDEDGKLIVVYHGTDSEFNVFDRTKSRANMDIQGNFFSPWEDDAAGYGSNVRKFYLNITNPASESTGYKALSQFKGQDNAGIKARDRLEQLGYDGVNNENEEYIAFTANQIKSADPVTYDEEGNIIPLSERFNEEKDDIRWSVGSRTKSFERGKKAGIKEQQRKQLQADRQNLSVYDKLAKQRTKDERKDAEATMRMHDKLIESVRKEEKALSKEDKKKLQREFKSKEKDWNKEYRKRVSEFKKEQRNAKKTLDSVIKQAEKERKDLERKLTAPQKKEMQKKQKDLDKARREERIRTAYNEYKRNSKPSEGSIESIYAKSKNARSLAAQMRRDIIKKIVELGKFTNANGMVVLDENGMEIATQNLETGEWDVSKHKNTYTPPFGLTLLAEKEGMDKDVFYTIYSKIAELRSAKDENGKRLHKKEDVIEYISMLDLPVKQKNFLYFDVAKYPYTKMPTFLAGGSIKEKAGNKRGGIIEAVDNIALDMFRGTVKDSQVFTSEDDTVQIQNEDLLNIADIVFGKEQSEEKEDFIYYLTETVLNYATQMENIRLIEKTKLLTNKPKEKNDIKAQVLNAYRESKKLFIAEGEAFERMSDKMDDILITARYYAAKKAPAIANEMIFGKTQRDLKGEYKGKSLYEIFKPIFRADEKAKNDKLMTELTELVNCRHDIYRLRNGKGFTGNSIEECEKIVARISKEHPELLKAADELADYGRNLLRMCVESGRISQADYDYFTTKYPYYVPTFRVRSNEFIDRKGNVVRRDSKVIRTSKGGNEDVLPLFDQFVHRTQEIVKACKKNQLATEMVRHINVPGMEEYISEVRVAENQENKDSSIADIGNIEDVGVARREDGMGNVIPWYSNGKKYDIVVRDKNLLFGWDRINYRREETSIETALRKMNNIRRGVLTQYNPTFWITNSIKDYQDMYLYNQHAQWLPVYHAIAAKTMFGGTTGVSKEAEERLQEYLSFGMSHASIFEYDNTTAGRRSKKTRTKEALTKPIELFDTLNFMTEQTPRFAVYLETYERLKEKQYKKGGNTLTDEEIKTIALYRAEDATLNFGRSGTVVKYMNTYGFTFINAGVQGMDRFRRMFVQVKDKDKKAMFINIVGLLMKMELFGVTGGIILSFLYGGDDEWSEALREFLYGEDADKVKQAYKEMDDYEKLNYYPINIGGVWIKIPRGRLSAFLFGPMYYGEKVHDGEMDMKELVEAQLDLASETILFSNPVTNNIAGPFIDVMLRNKDHWGNPIVSEYEDMGEGFHYLEYDEETTDLAIAVADALRFWDLSPKKMDYIIEQYLGSYSDLIMPFLSKGQNFGDRAMDMLMSLAGKFYIDPTSNNRLAGDYYDLKEEYENIANASDGDSPYAVAVKFFNEDTEQLKYLRDQIKAINADTTISRRERLDEVAKLKEQMNIIYRDGVSGAEGILAYAMENYTSGADVNELYDAWIRDNMSAEWRVAHFNDTEMERYNKITNAGCSSDNAVKAMDALAVLKPLDGESSVSDYQQVEAIAKLKLPAEEEVGAMAAVFNEKGYAKYTSMTPYGVTAQTWLDFEDALKEADKNNNGNGYYDNDEKQAALDSINASNSVRAVLWQSKDGKLGSTTYDTAWKAGRNPYDPGVASKMIDDYMAKIAGMEEEEEEKQYLPLSADYRISGEYGENRSDHIHSGIDLAVPEGSDVHAVMSGTVSFAGWKGGYGYRVVIDHPDGTQTAYSHLSDIGVKVGDDVDAGTVVALSGNTGYSTGPHLHFEVIEGGEYVNPEQYYDFGNGLKAEGDGNYVSQMSAVSGGYSGGGGGGSSRSSASTSSPGSRTSQVASNRRSGGGIYLPTASGSSVGRSGRSSSVAGMSTSNPTYGTRGVYLPKASDYTSGGSSIRSSVATTQRTGRTGGSFWNENILS